MREVDAAVNTTQLYNAIVNSDWEEASHACHCNPIEAKTWVVRRDTKPKDSDDDDASQTNDSILWRFLPLHSACARRPPSTFLRDLLAAYPKAASLKDESGMYALHYACGNRASKRVIELLVECFPQAVRETDPNGMLPLHYVAQWGPSEGGTVELLIDAYVEGAMAVNDEGMSPLDLCREGNYDGWEEVAMVMERMAGSKRSAVSLPHEVENEDRDDSLISSTVEVQRGKKSPRSSSRPQRDRSSSRSRRSSSRNRSEGYLDMRDDISTPRSHRLTSYASPRNQLTAARIAAGSLGNREHSRRSLDTTRPQSISCTPSPRYHERKTPRSSGGRGPGFNFGQKTPRSSSSRHSVQFSFDNESSVPSRESGDHMNHLSHEMEDVRRNVDVHVLQKENMELREENAQLRNENGQLQAQIA